jgi:hypothetical protein
MTELLGGAHYSAQQYGLPLGCEMKTAPDFGARRFMHARAEDRKLRKDPTFGGPCFEGTLQKPRLSLKDSFRIDVPWPGRVEQVVKPTL